MWVGDNFALVDMPLLPIVASYNEPNRSKIALAVRLVDSWI